MIRSGTPFIAALLVLTATAAAVPQPGSVGIRTLDANGAVIGGIDVRIEQLEGNWPEPTQVITTELLGLVWRSLLPGLYEIVALDDDTEPIPGTSQLVGVTSGAHDIIVIINMPAGGCFGDLNGSNDVDFADILALLASWGPCANCAADLDDDGTVAFSDLIALLGAWGGCPN